MDWVQFWSIVNENLGSILTSLFSLILSIISFVIAYFRTRTKKIKDTVNKQLVEKYLSLDLGKYYVEIEGKKYSLDKLEFKKYE